MGQEIRDKKEILKNYLQTNFVVDLLSSLPVELILPGSNWRLINVLKLQRITRISQVINKAPIHDDTKTALRILQLIFFLITFMHIVTCLWHRIVEADEIWIAPQDFVYAGNYPKIYNHYHEKTEMEMYYILFYNSALFIGGNEMGPRTSMEMAVSSFIMIGACCFNAWLFGEMAVLIEKFSSSFKMDEQEITNLFFFSCSFGLSKHITGDVFNFKRRNQETKREFDQLQFFFQDINTHLRKMVLDELFLSLFESDPLFNQHIKIKLNRFLEFNPAY